MAEQINWCSNLKDKTLLLRPGVNNLRSRRTIEKLGARLRAESREEDGHVVYEIKRTGQWSG